MKKREDLGRESVSNIALAAPKLVVAVALFIAISWVSKLYVGTGFWTATGTFTWALVNLGRFVFIAAAIAIVGFIINDVRNLGKGISGLLVVWGTPKGEAISDEEKASSNTVVTQVLFVATVALVYGLAFEFIYSIGSELAALTALVLLVWSVIALFRVRHSFSSLLSKTVEKWSKHVKVT